MNERYRRRSCTPLHRSLAAAALLVLVSLLPGIAAAQPGPGDELLDATLCDTETSTGDFGGGVLTGTAVTEVDKDATGGQVRLEPTLNDLFLVPTLDPMWEITRPALGYVPVIFDGTLDVQERDDAVYEISSLQTTATFGPGMTFEARAIIEPGSAFVNIGFVDDTVLTNEWAYFSTRGSGDGQVPMIYTSVRPDGFAMLNQPTTISLSEWHVFKIVWLADTIEFWVDDVLVDTRTDVTLNFPQRIGLYKSGGSDTPFLVDWVRLTPHTGSPGSFESQVRDAGQTGITWTDLTWQGAEPAGTGITFETRTGETAVPDTGWSAWAAVSGDSIASPAGRYLQYRATLSTGDLETSPVIDEITLCYTVLDVTPPTVSATSPPDGATDIVVGTTAAATFDEALDPATVTTGNFTLSVQGGSLVPATVSYDSASFTMTLTPDTDLAHGTIYEGRATTGLTDLDGNPLAADHVWTFTTVPPDLTAPTVTATDPADGAIEILAERPVTATFDEAVDQATLTTASFTLTPQGGSAVAATVSWDAETFTAILTPAAELDHDTVHEARLSTAVTDLAGNPLAQDEVWTFTTRVVPPLCAPATTVADFAAGLLAGTMVSETDSSAAGGQVRLQAALNDVFESPVLDPIWHATRPADYVPEITDGVLDVQDRTGMATAISAIESYETWGPGVVLEARAMFHTGSRFVDVGFVGSTYTNTQYAWFSTNGTGDQPGQERITARVRHFDHTTTAIDTDATFGEWHIFKIIWTHGLAEFYVDGALVATHTNVLITVPMHAALYKSNDSDTPFEIDWIRVTPYDGSPGSYESPVVDAGTPATVWTDLDWMGTTPTGTSVAFETRTGETAAPDGGWSAWTALDDGLVVNPPGRYGQYRATLATGDLLLTPVVDEIRLCYNAPTDTTPPSVVTTDPAADAVGVPVAAPLTAVFNKALDPTTVTAASFTLTPDGGSPLTATVDYDGATFTATLTPAAPLDFETLHTARLATTIADTVGNPLLAEYVWDFTTTAPPDSIAPTVLATVPAADAVDVAVDSLVTATFDEPIDPATLTTAAFTLVPDGGSAVPATVSLDPAGTLATLAPDAPLDFETLYTAQLATAITDTAGNALAADHVWSFTTAAAPVDTVGPVVLTTVPDTDAVDVLLDAQVTATFDEALDPATVTGASFTLTPDGGGALPATVTYDTTGFAAVLTPDAALVYETLYTARLTTALTDTSGNALATEYVWDFTSVAAPDTIAPMVLATDPIAGAVFVAVGTQVTATFDEALDPATLTTATFTLTPDGGSAVTATVSYDAFSFAAILTPDAPLALGTLYDAVLTTGVTDAAGNPLAADHTWSFTTVPPDQIPPTVTATDPLDGAVEVPVSWPVRATFDEAIDPATLTPASFTLTPLGGSAVAATVSFDTQSLTATLVPTVELDYAVLYEARLTTAVTDVAGNPLAQDEVWTFTTRLVAPLCAVTTTTADWALGALANTMVSETDSSAAGGQLRLEAPLSDLFLVPTLDPMWQITRPTLGFTPVIADGVLDVQERDDAVYDRSSLETTATFTADAVCEVRAIINPGSAFVSLGFFSSTTGLEQWIYFSTRGTGDDPVPVIYASTRDANGVIVSIPTSVTLGEWHDFKVVWEGATAEFYVDGALVDTRTGLNISLPQRLGFYKSAGSSSALPVDWVRVTPYSGVAGEIVSSVQDAGESGAHWTVLDWLGTVPVGASVVFETRSGETSTPDGTWSTWDAPVAGQIDSPPARYAQFRTTLNTTDPKASPVIDEVALCYFLETDTIPPAVVATVPLADAVDVPVTDPVTATFNEPVDPATLTPASFTLTPDGGAAVPATLAWDPVGFVATLTPDAALDFTTLYEARLTTALADTAGNNLPADHVWSFTTAAAPDTTGPSVLATLPVPDAVDIATDVQPTATFDQAIDVATLTPTSFTLTPDGGAAVPATVAWDTLTLTATLVPDTLLAHATLFEARVTTAVTDTLGNGLATDHVWSFTTIAAPDTTRPLIVSTGPEADAVEVPADTTVTAVFSEPVDPATLTDQSFTLTPQGGSAVLATVAWDSLTLTATLTPDHTLDGLTVYEARLTTAVTDTAGNALEAEYLWSFTTVDGPVSGVGELALPTATVLNQNAPNPFNPQTTVRFELKRDAMVRLSIYSVDGRLVRTLVTERMAAGRHSRIWNGRDNGGRTVTSGVYLMRMEAGEVVQTRKMLMMK